MTNPFRARLVALTIAALAIASSSSTAQSPRDFEGRWESISDDGTQQEVVELEASGTGLRGMLTVLEHGYFSRRTTVKQELPLSGVLSDRTLALQIGDGNGGSMPATAMRRGEYLVLRIKGREYGYARPGQPLVVSAEGSAEAARLAGAITGRIYSTSTQAGGRGGAVVGARTRLALCANGQIAFDESDVGSVPNGDMGSTRSRRGTWEVVLRAGAPVVRAQWEGTGSSYSLTEYFDVGPSSDGRAATVDGTRLPVTGQC